MPTLIIDMGTEYASIPVHPETRDMVRSLKRGGQDYDSLIQQMIQQYNPDEVAEHCE
jgi:hypothetical protein